jgi:hypothetical protein
MACNLKAQDEPPLSKRRQTKVQTWHFWRTCLEAAVILPLNHSQMTQTNTLVFKSTACSCPKRHRRYQPHGSRHDGPLDPILWFVNSLSTIRRRTVRTPYLSPTILVSSISISAVQLRHANVVGDSSLANATVESNRLAHRSLAIPWPPP